jgi:D-sedoheptulose 7-phosphate isomerase
MKNKAYIDNYLEDMKKIIKKMPQDKIDKAIELIYAAWKRKARIFVIGNGGSASTATHFACDLSKWASGDNPNRIKAFSLVDNIPLMSALTNDDGWDQVYLEQLKTNFVKGDLVIALSVHGGKGKDRAGVWSQNLTRAINYANNNGGNTIGFSGFDGGAFNELTDVNIVIPFESTPQVEAFHSVLTHLIADALRKKIIGLGGKK